MGHGWNQEVGEEPGSCSLAKWKDSPLPIAEDT